jgi:predicted DNA-binding transcriptional regulator YafY
MPRVKHRQERLQIIDELLFKFKHIESREELLKKVNQKLDRDKQVSLSSIDKDINELRDEAKNDGIDLRSNPYRYSDPEFRCYKQSLTEEDKTLLIIAQNLFQMFKETSLKSRFKELVDKVIANGGPSKFWGDISKFQFIQLESGVAAPNAHLLPDLIQHIYDKKAIRVKYGPDKEIKHLSPYVLKQYRGRWYFVAYDHSKSGEQAVKIYSLARVHQITASDKTYYQDPGFNAQEYFKYSIGIWHRHGVKPVKVQLEFTEPHIMEAVLEVPLHPTQKIISQSSKKLKIEIEVYESPELESLIRSYGGSGKEQNSKKV